MLEGRFVQYCAVTLLVVFMSSTLLANGVHDWRVAQYRVADNVSNCSLAFVNDKNEALYLDHLRQNYAIVYEGADLRIIASDYKEEHRKPIFFDPSPQSEEIAGRYLGVFPGENSSSCLMREHFQQLNKAIELETALSRKGRIAFYSVWTALGSLVTSFLIDRFRQDFLFPYQNPKSLDSRESRVNAEFGLAVSGAVLFGSLLATIMCKVSSRDLSLQCNPMSLYSAESQHGGLCFNPSSYEQHRQMEAVVVKSEVYAAFVAFAWVLVSAVLGTGYVLRSEER